MKPFDVEKLPEISSFRVTAEIDKSLAVRTIDHARNLFGYLKLPF